MSSVSQSNLGKETVDEHSFFEESSLNRGQSFIHLLQFYNNILFKNTLDQPHRMQNMSVIPYVVFHYYYTKIIDYD